MDVRNKGKWEAWVKFFLRGIVEISNESAASARTIDTLRETLSTKIDNLDAAVAVNARRLLDQLFVTPQVTRLSVAKALGVTAPTAGSLIKRFEDELGILKDVTPELTRNKRYVFGEYMDILESGTE